MQEHNSNHHSNGGQDQEHKAMPLLTVADFDGNGVVNQNDIKDLKSRINSIEGSEGYHPLYDLNADGQLDSQDENLAVETLGKEVSLLDQQIAQATQATIKYYGPNGLENAIADGYIPLTPEIKGHGSHWYNPGLIAEVGNLENLDIKRPIGLNYDEQSNLVAVNYIRLPQILEGNPLEVDPEDDLPPASFDTLTADDWHFHVNVWRITGIGDLNPESVYVEDNVPSEVIPSRLEQIDSFPELDQGYIPKFWMLHAWIHSLNPKGVFANTNPNVSFYAPEELGAHSTHLDIPFISGTDEGEQLRGAPEDERINAFGGDDQITGGGGNDLIWGSLGDDLIRGDSNDPSSSGNDMIYGGAGKDVIDGQGGNDRLFGGTEDDIIVGGQGDDLLRGSLGYDILTGDEGADNFVLVSGEDTDIITDLELELDTIVLYGGLTKDNISIEPIGNNTALGFNNETLAIISGIDASALRAASDDVFLVA